MKPLSTKLPSLILPVATKLDAEEQYAMARDLYQEKATSETYAAMCRAYMVLQTKTIELTPEQLKELRGDKQ